MIVKVKSQIIIVVISIGLFIFGLSSITYAYINRAFIKGDTVVTGLTYSGIIFNGTVSGGLNYTLPASQSGTGSDNLSSFVDSSSVSMTVTLTASASVWPSGATCTYNIYYNPTNGDFLRSDHAIDVNKPDISIVLAPSSSWANSIVVPIHGHIGSFDLATGKTIHGTSTQASATWYFKYRFYNLNGSQDDILGRNIAGRIGVKVTGCAA